MPTAETRRGWLPARTVDRLTIAALAFHLLLAGLCLAHMKDTRLTGDEIPYMEATEALGRVVRATFSGQTGVAEDLEIVVGQGWFMPGMPLLLAPLAVVDPEPDPGTARVFVGIATLALLLFAVAQVRRHVGPGSGLALALLLGASPMWTLYSFTLWGDLSGGLVAIVIAARSIGHGRGMARGEIPTRSQLAGLGALLGALVLLRASALPLVPITLALWAVLAIVLLPDAARVRSTLMRLGLAAAVFFALLLPWSVLASTTLRTPVLTTTSVALSIAVTFGDVSRLCDEPCRPGDVWWKAFAYSKKRSHRSGRDLFAIQRRMARDALENTTLEEYLRQLKRNSIQYYLQYNRFMGRFMLAHEKGAPASLVMRWHVPLRMLTSLLYGTGLIAFVLCMIWPVRGEVGTQISSLVLKGFGTGLALQPFVHLSHGRYWPILAPVFALCLPLLLQIARREWGLGWRPARSPAERWLFAAQIPLSAIAIAFVAALWTVD